MQLKLENIGKVKSADVEIDGITVIAGENDTGKSTVGKVLYCIFNSFYNIDEAILAYKKQSVYQQLMRADLGIMPADRRVFPIDEIFDELKNAVGETADEPNLDALGEKIIEICLQNGIDGESLRENVGSIAKQIAHIYSIPDETAHREISQRMFNVEFLGQINNVHTPVDGSIVLRIKNQVVSIGAENNVISVKNAGIQLSTEVIYIDNPLVLDSASRFGPSRSRYSGVIQYRNHELNLTSKLVSQENENNVISEIVSSQRIDSILEKLNAVCAGELDFSKPTIQYRKSGVSTPFKVQNLSMGLKTFAIIKTLLTNGSLEDKGTIILDEPEIHLHPKWQLVFAELIVLIQKEFNMHILLSTHSPYFLRAIEVYAAAHGVNERCRYYLAENVDDQQSVIRDVTQNIEPIYQILAEPFQVLENERSKLI